MKDRFKLKNIARDLEAWASKRRDAKRNDMFTRGFVWARQNHQNSFFTSLENIESYIRANEPLDGEYERWFSRGALHYIESQKNLVDSSKID